MTHSLFSVHKTILIVSLMISFLWFSFATSTQQRDFQKDGKVPLSTYDDIEKEFTGWFTNKDNTVIDILVKFQTTGNKKSDLIEYYCDTRLWTHNENNKKIEKVPDLAFTYIDYNGMRFDPRQSMFVYGLCRWYATDTSLSRWDDSFEATYIIPRSNDPQDNVNKEIVVNIEDFIPDDIKNNLLEERWELEEKKDPCDPSQWMSECRMWYPSWNILRNVFGVYFDLKKAAIDGVNHGKEKKDIDESIDDFSRALFNQESAKSGICNDSSKVFIWKQDSSSNNDTSHCGHPQTNAFVEGMIEWAIQDIERIDKMDVEKIIAAECESTRAHLLSCAMSTIPDEYKNPLDDPTGIHASEEVAWKNLIANELFYASMRKEFYTVQISKDTKFQWLDKQDNLIWSNASIAQMEIASMNLEFDMIQRASETLMTLLTQYRSMYHQCVALSAHQEDLHYFRQRMNKMYTPLQQLSTTFNNHQENKSQ